jgi:diguanylate cyclase (GGDEF)-like protein/PAS domain S-box-containing protein
MHDRRIFGDLVKRMSFRKASDTKQPSSEMELGKTAFALRAVMPYYNAGTLIGYVEMGEEIGHFSKILKGETDSELAIIADKKHLDRDDWQSVRRVARLRDNWDDLEKHLILNSTSESEAAAQCFTEDNLERVERKERAVFQLRSSDRMYMCGGFGLDDAGGRHIGAVLTLTDITDHLVFAQKANNDILRMAVILFFVTFTAGILISRSITKPILRLAEVAKAVGGGDLDRRAALGSHDEIGQLGATLNAMIEMRKQTEEALQKSEEKYRSLVESTDDSIYLVDKNYRYLYMNKKHMTRMGFSRVRYEGFAYSEFHSPEETKDFIGEVSKVFETGESTRHEHLSRRDKRSFLRTLSPVKDAEGNVIAVNVVSKDVTELKQMQEKLRTLSLTDELTGLYNRRGFFMMVEQLLKLAKRQKRGIFMLYADMDNLKEINDTLGHQEGDQALIDTANILKATYRDTDIVARLGGDEFVVLPVGRAGDNIGLITARLQENLESHAAEGNRNFRLSLSVGISYYDPESPCSIDELIKQGEKLMYEQKVFKRSS